MFVNDEPAAILLAQNGGATPSAGGFLTFDQALSSEFVVT